MILFYFKMTSSRWGRIFWKILLTSLTENQQKNVMSFDKKWPKPHVGAELDMDSACLKNPITTFHLTILMWMNFSQLFWL